MLETTYSARLLPPSHSSLTPTTSPLSILDSKVASYSPTSAVWAYPCSTLTPSTLTTSLQQALDFYPQWCGHLRVVSPPPDPSNVPNHTKRFGRLEVAWGTSDDPGVEVVVATTSTSVASTFPSRTERLASNDVFDSTHLDAFPLLPSCPPLAPGNLRKPIAGLPSVVIQITSFSCSGLAIAVKIAHSLADATSLHQFMRDWATVHRSIATKSPLPSITPLFNYALIDSQAAGDIEAILPDPSVVESSKEVPIHRYDWWASAENAHSWALEQTTVPDGLSGKEVGDLGKPLPWKEWDPSKPVRHVVLHFSEAEVEKMWMEASGGITGTEVRISRSDALLAHMWQLVIRARNPTDGEVHLDVTLGTRARLDLPPSTLGSPLFNIPVTSTPSTLFSSTSLSSIARLLRTSVSRYTRSAIASLLHRWSHDTAPWRYWDCFLGERHTIVTSWLRAGSWDVVFEEGVRPVYVAPIMPSCDGCLCLAEAGAGGWKAGVDVHLLMKDDVVKKILADEALRRFGS